MATENRLKSSLTSSLNLKSSILTSTSTPLTSSILKSSSLLSSNTISAESKAQITDIKTSSLHKLSQLTTVEKKKKIDSLQNQNEVEAKKPKILSNENSLIKSKNNFSSFTNSNLATSAQLASKYSSSFLMTNKSPSFNLLSSNLSKTSLTTLTILQNKTQSLSLTSENKKNKLEDSFENLPATKKVFFSLDSEENNEGNDKIITSSFIKEEFLKTEELIKLIDQEHRQAEEAFSKKNKLKQSRNFKMIDNRRLSTNREEYILKFNKKILINLVSSSLLRQPNFKNIHDSTRNEIINSSQIVIRSDPEFILKLALYTRRELNIRVTANFLVCLASFQEDCRIFLQRYFKETVMLPSDWIEIAEQYQLFMDKKLNFGSLPSALRKCMVDKFPYFDQYQLAKYNKEKSRSAKNSKLFGIKHFKSKLKDGEKELNVDEKPVVEDKYVKALNNGVKINDRVVFQILVNEKCNNLKIDFIKRNDLAQTKTKNLQQSKTRRGFVLQKKKETSEVEESVAVRINVDYVNKRITQKSFINKAWSKRSENVNKPKKFYFNKPSLINFYVDINPSEFVFGFIEDENARYNDLAKYSHSKHNIELHSLNGLRLSGVGIKLKDLKITSRDLVVLDSQQSEENEKEIKQRSYTLKQLIRQLHISQPVENVMSLLGKKYPSTFEEFMQSKLPGIYESERANKRMKLKTPETWEVMISMQGNKASVWESLIDKKKLPYMAMLRNLRNMIKCGISDKHHNWVIKKLQDEGAVIHSKQFPFRFFTAYEIIDELQEDFEEYLKWCENPEIEPKPSHKNAKIKNKKNDKQKQYKDMNYDLALLKRYKTALDNALKVATIYNVPPIKGRTLILLNLGQEMNYFLNEKTGKSLGKKVSSLADLGSLLALMFKYSCEYGKLIAFNDSSVYSNIELEQNTILDNMKSLVNIKNVKTDPSSYRNLRDVLQSISLDKEHYDNLVLISNEITEMSNIRYFQEVLRKYRSDINKNLLFVKVNLSGSECSVANDQNFKNKNDVCISGFSDAILRFVAERGNQGQLIHIENIDKSYELPAIKNKNFTNEQKVSVKPGIDRPKLKLIIPISQWKTVNCFISSTFLDFHSERDILTKTVFPMLRSKLASRLITLNEIDLRWGLTESDSTNNQTLDICLSQVLESDYFIALLGKRYGSTFDSYLVKQNERLKWLDNYPKGASITELEIECFLRKIQNQNDKYERAFFYIRNKEFLKDVPNNYLEHFLKKNVYELEKLKNLEDKIYSTSYEIYNNYPCKWFKVDENNRALVCDLDEFARHVFNSLFNSIKNHNNEVNVELNESLHLTSINDAFVKLCSEMFVGRQKLSAKFEKLLNNNSLIDIKNSTTQVAQELIKKQNSTVNIVLITGGVGCGKSTFLSAYLLNDKYNKDILANNFVHFVGSYDGSEYTTYMLKRFCVLISNLYGFIQDFDDNELNNSNDINFYKKVFAEILQKLNKILLSDRKFFIIIDGVDLLQDDQKNIDESFSWIPDKIPPNISFIFTARSTSNTSSILGKLSSKNNSNKIKLDLFEIEDLDILDKGELVKMQLSKYSKHLDESPFNNQMKLLTNKRDSLNPFYLSLACQELRMHNQYETLNNKLRELPAKLNLLIDYVLDKLEENFESQFVNAAFMFICCSKDGVTEKELNDLLKLRSLVAISNLDEAIEKCKSIFNLDRQILNSLTYYGSYALSTAKFLSFIQSIETFLKPRSNKGVLLIKSNSFITNALKSRYGQKLNSKTTEKNKLSIDLANKLMSVYYWSLIDKNFDHKYAKASQRAFTYLPFHLAISNMHLDLSFLLCDLRFLSMKCDQNLAAQLMDDFDLHQSFNNKNILLSGTSANIKVKPSTSLTNNTNFNDYKHFITTNYHLFILNPNLIFQQAMNQHEESSPAKDLRKLLRENNDISGLFLFEWLRNTSDEEENKIIPVKINDFDVPISSICISPNGQIVACGTENCEIKLYTLSTASLFKTLHGHSGRINQLCFIDLDRLCSVASDGLASLWNVSAGFRYKILDKSSDHAISGCCVDSSNSKTLLTVGYDCKARLWDPNEGKLLGELSGHTKPINCVAFSPLRDNLCATGCWDSLIRIFNIVDRSRKAILRGHKTSVQSISYSNSGTYIASSSLDEVKLWNSKTGSPIASLTSNSLSVNSVAFSPNNSFLATGSSDRSVKLWTESIGRTIRIIKENIIDKQLITTCICFNQKDGETFAVGYNNGMLKIYGTIDGNLKCSIKPHNASVKRIKFTKHGFYLISASENGSIKIIDVSSFEGPVEKYELIGNTSCLNALAVNSSNVIVTGSEDCSLSVYGAFMVKLEESLENFDQYFMDTDQKNYSIKNKNVIEKLIPSYQFTSHKSPITGISFNNSGNKFVSTSKDACIIVWSLEKKLPSDFEITELYSIQNAHSDWITDVEWSINSDFFLTSSNDYSLKIWGSNDGKERSVLLGHTANINSCSFQYGCAVSTCYDGSIKIWSHKGHEVGTLLGHQSRVTGCDLWVKLDQNELKKNIENAEEMDLGNLWSDKVLEEEINEKNKKMKKVKHQDFKIEQVYLVTVSDDSTIRLWKPIEADYLLNLESHNDKVNALSFSVDGVLASASSDRTVSLWNMKEYFKSVKSGSIVNSNINHKHNTEITYMCANKSGEFLLTGSHDGILFLWSVDNDNSTISKLSFILDLKAHEKSIESICILDERIDKNDKIIQFATGSSDHFIKIWTLKKSLRKLNDPTIELTKKYRRFSSVIHLEKIESLNYLAVVENASNLNFDQIFIQFFQIKNGNIIQKNYQFILSNASLLISSIKCIDNILYLTFLHNEIVCIDLIKLYHILEVKSVFADLLNGLNELSKSFICQSKIAELPLKLDDDDSEKLWFSSIYKHDDYTFYGDWQGNLHVGSESGINLCKSIHNAKITQLVHFKNNHNFQRIVSASQDGTIKILSVEIDSNQTELTQLGQFNTNNGITKLMLLKQDNTSFYFVFGDQMGNLSMIKWYDI